MLWLGCSHAHRRTGFSLLSGGGGAAAGGEAMDTAQRAALAALMRDIAAGAGSPLAAADDASLAGAS